MTQGKPMSGSRNGRKSRARASAGPTLPFTEILEGLDEASIIVVVPPSRPDAAVGRVVIYDQLRSSSILRNDLVLAVGAGSKDNRTRALLHEAGAAGAAAIVVGRSEES